MLISTPPSTDVAPISPHDDIISPSITNRSLAGRAERHDAPRASRRRHTPPFDDPFRAAERAPSRPPRCSSRGARPARGQVNVRIVERFQARPRGGGTRDARPRRGRQAWPTRCSDGSPSSPRGREAAVAARDDALASHHTGEPLDAVGDQLRVLDQHAGLRDDAGNQDLIVRQLHVLSHAPLVLVARDWQPRTNRRRRGCSG